jgi:hypothetical protein
VPKIDTSRAHPARMYDYLLGGKDNFDADRAAIAALLKSVPNARTGARENRAFLGRAVRYLTAEVGIRQFLDIGSGLPTAGNVHEVAQSVAPESRVMYLDNDPIVMAHARALLVSHPAGRTAYVQADLHDPEAILALPAVRETLDFGQPVALMLLAVLHFFPDEEDPHGIVATLLRALPPGSYLVASHVTSDYNDPDAAANGVQAVQSRGVPIRPRTARSSPTLRSLAWSWYRLAWCQCPSGGPTPRPTGCGPCRWKLATTGQSAENRTHRREGSSVP